MKKHVLPLWPQVKTKSLTGLLSVLFIFLVVSCGKEEEKDPCLSKVCLNGGECVSGTCQCPVGYEGSTCEKEKLPKAVVLKSVTIVKFPVTKPNGDPWDANPNSGPDLYVDISVETPFKNVFDASTYVSDAVNVAAGHTYRPSETSRITNMTAKHLITAVDYDEQSTTDEGLYTIRFTPTDYLKGFPKTWIISCTASGCPVEFSVEVEYEF